MKKVYIILVLFVFSLPALSQNTSSINPEGDWALFSSWSNGMPSSGEEITILENHKIYISSNITIEGSPVTLIVYGVLEFSQAGKLKLPSGSVIDIKSGGDFVVPNTNNNSTVLEIGGASVRSVDIDNLVGPATITEGNLECGGCAMLPVELLFFKATAHSSSVEINWASSKAWDFSHYELERSVDGKAFDLIATIDAEEISNETVEYTYSDRQPLHGVSYYRLKAVDVDGSFEYKAVELLKFGAESFNVFPNPSSIGYFYVSWSHATEGTSLNLRDSVGRTVRNTNLSADESTVSTEGLPAGFYYLTVQSPVGMQQTQVVIK